MTPATIHEDLRCRDFTVNAIALSLNKASLGLLIDPTNGVGDIERKELRAIHNYSFYDDPSRMLRLIRFKVRLGYADRRAHRAAIRKRARSRDADAHHPEALGAELRHMAEEPNAGDLMQALEEEKLIELVLARAQRRRSPICRRFAKLQKARQMAPVRMGSAHEQPAAVPDRAARKAQRQGAAGADQGGRARQKPKSLPLAETGGGREETGARTRRAPNCRRRRSFIS